MLENFVEFDNNSLKTAVSVHILDPITNTVLYGTINSWNTAKVTDMNRLFQYKSSFNGNISKWDVSRVTTMEVSIFFHYIFFILNFQFF